MKIIDRKRITESAIARSRAVARRSRSKLGNSSHPLLNPPPSRGREGWGGLLHFVRNDIASGESGFTLIIIMLVLLMMTILGLNAIFSTGTDIQISGNEKTSVKTLSIAEAGLQHSLRVLRGQDFSTLLANATSTSDYVPLVLTGNQNTISFDGGNYTISIRNNYKTTDSSYQPLPGAGAGQTVYNSDTDGIIILRSVAAYKGVTKIVEAQVRRIAANFPIDGGLGITGALQEIDINGQAFRISGNNTQPPGGSGSWPATTCSASSGIALGDCRSRCVIIGCPTTDPCYVASSHTLNAGQLGNITGTGNPSVQTNTDPNFTTSSIQTTVNNLIPFADRTINIDTDTSMQNISWGTFDNPQITYVKFTNLTDHKELRIEGNSTGYGILIIDASSSTNGGELDLRGNFSWYGPIIFTNYAEAELGSGGNINIYGGLILATTATSNTADTEVEIRGNTQIYYSCAANQRAQNYSALTVSSWHEVSS